MPLVALGGLVAAPAHALELGDLTVESKLGQPLRASIAYALAPNEMLSNTCVAVSAARSTGGLPGIGANTVRITQRAIVITGDAAILEPMLGTRVTINCPYTPNLSREYLLFVDPAGVIVEQRDPATAATRPTARTAAESRITNQPRSAPRPRVDDTPVGQASRYQVRPGDTLSAIVGRIENRSMPLWPAVSAVFAANPGAFIDNDPNRLKAGSWLTIPRLDGTAPAVAAAVPAGEQPVASAAVEARTVAAPAPATVEPVEMTGRTIPDASPALAEIPKDYADSTADLKPGDVVLDGLLPMPGITVGVPEGDIEEPPVGASSPGAVPTAIVSTGTRSESTSMLMWLVGAGLAIIAALLLFGRRARERFFPTPVAAAATQPARRQHDATEQPEIFPGYDIADDSPTDENPVLDADLLLGRGLSDGVAVDVVQDFGFAATTDLDIELPFVPLASTPDVDTDIIPPLTSKIESILESEVLPEDDDYDMSVIIDATQMPQPDDVTARDFRAVAVDEERQGDDPEEQFTVIQEADFNLLEQDYEVELTATQALNKEIERAAAQLAEDLNATVDDEKTAALPPVTALDVADDVTAEMPSRDAEATVEFEASYDPNDTNAVTVNMSQEDPTTEMRVANDDETVAMDVARDKVKTRRT